MKFAVVTSATYLILPQYILGLVLLAPPGTHHKEEGDDNLELIDLDDSLTQLSWTVPMSNLERAVLPLDDEDGTLTKDLLSLRRGKSRPKNSLRSLNSHRHEILKNNSDLFSDVGHSLEQAGDSSTRQISHVTSRSGSIPDARGPQLSHLVETVTQSLRGRIELRANGSIDTPLRTKHRRVPGRVQTDSSNDSSKSSTSQKQSSVSQGEDVLSQGRRSQVHNITQSDSSASRK
ncbi:uncharacterized protein LOC106069401 [Biomphalaria glabrata]|uniref:Uncharacterized protein LOC106069401 n=1 Tax=Biomphalaria glabrata TaxID=6526 RepID=A0A9W2ZWW6_BIOGL|nr:uncharacterized protein LOC106069401 [Biomphalaria glabrata]